MSFLVPMLQASGTYAVLLAWVCMYVCVCMCVAMYSLRSEAEQRNPVSVFVCVCVCVTPLVTTITQEPYIVQMS